MRIEQLPNGAYVRKLNQVEEEIITRLFQEINQREADIAASTIRVNGLIDNITGLETLMDNVNISIAAMQKQLDTLFGTSSEAVIDRNLKVTGWSQAQYFVSTAESGPVIRAQSKDLNPNFNSEFLQGKTPSDFVKSNAPEIALLSSIDYVRIVSGGTDSPRSGETICLFNGKPVLVTTTQLHGRGWNLAAYKRSTRTIEWTSTYDTHADTTNSTAQAERTRFVQDLNALDESYLVFIWGYDQPSVDDKRGSNLFTQDEIDGVFAALYNCGASKAVSMPYRSSYALIGIPNIGMGNGIEQVGYPNPVETGTLIIGGNPIGLNHTYSN